MFIRRIYFQDTLIISLFLSLHASSNDLRNNISPCVEVDITITARFKAGRQLLPGSSLDEELFFFKLYIYESNTQLLFFKILIFWWNENITNMLIV